MTDTCLIDYYRKIGLGPIMDRCSIHTVINSFHTIYGGGYSTAAKKASRRLYRHLMKDDPVCEVIIWKKNT